MSSKMLAGKKKYETFMTKAKKEGKSHKEALEEWKNEKSNVKKQPESSKVSPKKRTKKKPRQSGFIRPSKLWSKLTSTPSLQSRVRIETINQAYRK